MKTDLYSTPDVFETLAGEWDRILNPARSDNFFLRCDWQRIWWEHLGRGQLCVITIREGGRLRGIGPWFITEMGDEHVVRTVGCTDVTDYLDIVTEPGYEEPVTEALLDFMISSDAPQWDRISLCNIPESSPTCELFARLAQARGLDVEVALQDVCPVVDLPGTYDEYLDSLDKKQRHELRRKRRRAEAAGVGWYIVGPEHDLEEEIEAFLDLMAMSTQEKADFLKQPGHRAFFHDIGRATFGQGLLELIFLTVDNARAAAMWQFVYRDRMLLYNSGLNQADFSGLSPGIVLLTYSVEDAIRRGIQKYDFLRGDEAYKYRMGAKDTKVFKINVRR